MMQHLRRRFWIEAVLGFTTGALVMLSMFSRAWIEVLLGVDPDNSSGSLEWTVVGAAFAVTITVSVLARLEWRRTKLAGAAQAH